MIRWPGPASHATAIACSADAREPKGSGSRSVPAVRSANGALSSKSRPGERKGTALGWADAVLASVMMGDGGAGRGSSDGDRDPVAPATAGVAKRDELGPGAGSGDAGGAAAELGMSGEGGGEEWPAAAAAESSAVGALWMFSAVGAF